jgi:hypothetical protein
MVNSKINKKINYLEVNSVDLNDINYESEIYLGTLYNKNINFTIGSPMYDYIDFNVIYLYLYLVKKDEIIMKIGLYEFSKETFEHLNVKDDIDITNQNPIIFSYVKSFIMNNYEENDILYDKETNLPDDHSQDEEDFLEEEQDLEVDALPVAPKIKINKSLKNDSTKLLKEQTKEESDTEIFEYIEKKSDKWINKYLQSNKYDILDNEGGGDCFFAVLRDALKSSELEKYKYISVAKIRKKLSEEVDDEIFNNYKELSGYFMGGLKQTLQEINESKKNHSLLKKQIGGVISSEEKDTILNTAKSNIQKLNDTVDKQKELKKILHEEFKFMNNVSNIQDLKNVINTNNYWADIWAITNLERIFNVKFIIFSKEHFQNDEMDNVIKCYDMDKKIVESGKFEPEFYILVNYEQDVHYKLISYDKNLNKSIFKFTEIPYRVKELFVEKCIEMQNFKSNYLIIPDINNFIELKSDNDDQSIYKAKSKTELEFDTFLNKTKDLEYDENVIIQFYNKSMDKKLGEGTGETISKEYRTLPNILKLNKIKSWRKKLDNSWIVENLTIDSYNFSSVQHYIYALRFNNIKEIFSKFIKDNSHPAGNDIDQAKKLYDSILKDKKSYDFNFISEGEYEDIIEKNMEKALYSKFNQNKELLEILKLTNNYKLNIYKQKLGVFLAKDLIKVRNILNK